MRCGLQSNWGLACRRWGGRGRKMNNRGREREDEKMWGGRVEVWKIHKGLKIELNNRGAQCKNATNFCSPVPKLSPYTHRCHIYSKRVVNHLFLRE